ncbi:hypothetical protein SDC9_193602 [bioreactor metagenome]|uniref:Uncharacterized protein n=1 Tax=bioreactor metagenome TaxID=1076179 RepID=A0A645IF74_9ZZZZ
MAQVRLNDKPYYQELDDPILDAVVNSAKTMNEQITFRDRFITPEERGIVLFEAARKALIKAKQDGIKAPYHQPKTYEDDAWYDDEDYDIPEEAFAE